jgi:hypothetical protein
VHPGVTIEFTGRVLSEAICALAGLIVARQLRVMLLARQMREATCFMRAFVNNWK